MLPSAHYGSSWGLNASEQHALQTLCGKNPASRFGSVQELLVELETSEVASKDSAVDTKSMPIEVKQASVESVMQSLSQLKKDRTKQRSKSKRPVWLSPNDRSHLRGFVVGVDCLSRHRFERSSLQGCIGCDGGTTQAGWSQDSRRKRESSNGRAKAAVVDPLQQAFQVVEGDPSSLWLPPSLPEPCTLELFPLGAQAICFSIQV